MSQFHIQLWPGYQTSIRAHEKDILLNCDIIHKVMRTDTVYDLMKEIHRTDGSNFENSFKQKVLGMTVLTGYNNTTYRIDDVDFKLSPMSTFKKKDQEMTIKAYYAEVNKHFEAIFSKILKFIFIFDLFFMNRNIKSRFETQINRC